MANYSDFDLHVFYSVRQIDAAYVNTLVGLVNACRDYGIEIDEVCAMQNGWRVTFKGHEGADAICHDGSYGSPCRGCGLDATHDNDWSESGEWETIGFPWDGEDVSVHSNKELAFYIYCLNLSEGPYPWDEEN